jgi:hypothetical protein
MVQHPAGDDQVHAGSGQRQPLGVCPQQWPRPGRSRLLEHALGQVDADHRQPGHRSGQPGGQPPRPAANVDYRLAGPHRPAEQILDLVQCPPRRALVVHDREPLVVVGTLVVVEDPIDANGLGVVHDGALYLRFRRGLQ